MATHSPRRIGVLGGGQLGRMLALAGHPLGIECLFLDPAEHSCAADVGRRLRADYDDDAVLRALASACEIVTLEFENVPLATLEALAAQTMVRPGQRALEIAQDRKREKECFAELGIPVGDWVAVNTGEELAEAVVHIGTPCVLKTRRMGYDGKGQAVIRGPEDVTTAWEHIGQQPAIVETLIPLAREVSAIAVRSASGELRFYPLSENVHREGILYSARPSPQDALTEAAQEYAQRLIEATDYIGVLAMEFFVAEDGRLLANEFAPRVHNSGHWSIEGAICSQFENHLRAVADLPLGDTGLREHCQMINLLGAVPAHEQLLAIPGVHLHDYAKAARAGRKVGHITVTGESADTVARRCAEAEAVIAACSALDRN